MGLVSCADSVLTLAVWAGTAGLWVGITPIKVPVFEMV